MKKVLNVRHILDTWLKENNYDGLCSDECGCEIGDLAPCWDNDLTNCVPGHKTKCPATEEDGCEFATHDRECDWHMSPGKRRGKGKK